MDRGFLSGSVVKNPPAMRETQVRSPRWEDPLEEGVQPTVVFLPGESHGQKSQLGYSTWGHKVWATTEATEHACLIYVTTELYVGRQYT